MTAAKIAEEAKSLIGVPFRLHGRDPRYGLDCVGLAAHCLEAAGREGNVPSDYRLKNLSVREWFGSARSFGLTEVAGESEAGDILLVVAAPAQFHILIATGGGAFVHAHAGLGKVAIATAPLQWPVAKHWRLQPKIED
ncbi:NlpC /P60 family peptidase [Altererythrobacter epoxidivorans]|uniref:NlpC /P60 family peptidase n=1 Tax=Altererythrobacter epoxidivorans TaxID=361183 RepID=A0A0M4LXM0_9SPHN|nr:C40 family peptidase [Altererythrobacter epoxidivorans]ALE17997.1 NlpC /P60 family peptidase [Altererythrobacter epoxidivorans]